ncbi:SAM-dependent methyltransferase [Tolypothrix sp. FACHB-123]|uniref:SAM-dependent methyltransferase n=1 Tax=Tolypothrix sp. FACHB-123 TaxID=2692868 RepID=UPI0016865549|nr:SAM-dependent methyltransferase [Tolypothrix sp. FACHB-123]MBD2354102.1 SAM-dependent methyltransferase [Tolypothrix sp. FACHB-123]
MTQTFRSKIEYGDFQTPIELAEKICHKLVELGIKPDIIIEPTCGLGNFIKASTHIFPSARKIIGMEINQNYINAINNEELLLADKRIKVQQADFFQFDWQSLIRENQENILAIGNFPWVTNSRQGVIHGVNLPLKSNFQKLNGLDAITGKSNFDVSEWMLIRIVQYLQKYHAYLAMLCKTSVSRKLLNYIHAQKISLEYCATYKIDAKKYFGANVDACLLLCKFDSISHNYFCDVFNNLKDKNYQRIGYKDNILVKDVFVFNKLKDLYALDSGEKWRSGIKHDCSDVMELSKINDIYINGLGEIVDIEEKFIFPLIKGSNVAQGRTQVTNRYVLVTQRFIGESTEYIKNIAPKTWNYLEFHANYLDGRKSKIYHNNPRFSIFGVGNYTFLPWKIAICGLYKKLNFQLIGTIDNKPTVFDDTVYFLAFDNEQSAEQALIILTSTLASDFYSSLIFWDEKRPIKSSILNKLNLSALAQRLNLVQSLQ